MTKRNNLVGKKFGSLSVIADDEINETGKAKYVVLCDCGKLKSCFGDNLIRGRSKTCGRFKCTELLKDK